MSFETISLLLHWMEMGVLLAILFRLSNTFQLIANTQRELQSISWAGIDPLSRAPGAQFMNRRAGLCSVPDRCVPTPGR